MIKPPPINNIVVIIKDIPLRIIHNPKKFSNVHTLNNLLLNEFLCLILPLVPLTLPLFGLDPEPLLPFPDELISLRFVFP